MESLENKKHYEWLTSANKGRVETYLAEDDTNIYFESGRTIPKENFGSELVQIDEDVFLRKYKQELFSPIQFVNTKANVSIDLGNPTPTPLENDIINKREEEQNPIKIILDKQRKKETIILSLDIDIEVPNPKVIELLSLMFDREEIIKEIIKSSTQKIDNQTVIEKIKDSVSKKILDLFDEEKDDSKNEMQTS
jgi:hypothetical protein